MKTKHRPVVMHLWSQDSARRVAVLEADVNLDQRVVKSTQRQPCRMAPAQPSCSPLLHVLLLALDAVCQPLLVLLPLRHLLLICVKVAPMVGQLLPLEHNDLLQQWNRGSASGIAHLHECA
jgi:hypothetical protein